MFSTILNRPSQLGANFPCVGSFLASVLILHTRSPSLKVLGLTLPLNLLHALRFTASSLIFSFSRSSSIKSKFVIKHSLLIFQSSICLHKVSSFTSTGSMASVLYVRLNGVSPVIVYGVHLYAHSISGNFSAHNPFAFPSLLFNWSRMTLFVEFACPFVCGCSIEVVIDLTLKSAENSISFFSVNFRSLSVIIVHGIPNLQIIFFHTNF